MKRNNWTRLLAMALAIALLSGLALTAGANSITGDINGDGKVSAFDAQMLLEAQKNLRTLTDEQKAAAGELTLSDILKTILGGSISAGDTDSDGVIEIYSAKGLLQVANDPTASYILMNDIDMTGIDWIPIAKFTGTFHGNGKTVSNVNISRSVSGLYSSKTTGINMGFFGDCSSTAVITDLNLKDVTITATDDSQYIGLVIGSNRGKVENCTATGTIIDTRETYENDTYIGVMAGRICTPSAGVEAGSMIGGTSISVTDNAGVVTTTGLCANVKLQIANRDQLNKASNAYSKIGLVGWTTSTATVSGQWAETSNDSALLSADIQARQTKVVDYMNEMGTVEWIPSQDLTYTPQEGGGKTYYAQTTYKGLPYNRNNGSLERFQSALNEDGTTLESLGSCIWNETDGYTGFVQLMGNNCSTAVGWAWMQTSPVIVELMPSHSNPYHGGVYVVATKYMIPTDANRETYGIYPVGSWTSDNYDPAQAAYQCTDEKYSSQVLATNGADTILEAYAQTRKADAIVVYAEKYSEDITNAGHARLVAADPIVIRNADGTIDSEKSYMITTEQGSSTGSTSTWKVNYKYTFKTLLDNTAEEGSTGYGRTYLPITMRALRDETLRNSYVTKYSGEHAINAPDSGWFYSNYRIVSTTVTVKNGDTVIYEGEKFTGVGTKSSQTTGKFQTADLADHSEAFAAAAEAAELTDGEYTFSVQVLLSDGKVVNAVTDQTFDYTVPVVEEETTEPAA